MLLIDCGLDVNSNKEYDERMATCNSLPTDRRQFLALTGVTPSAFQLLFRAFARAYDRVYPTDQTLTDQPRQRVSGGGCEGGLYPPEQKLLFILVYLKTYPLQVLTGELFEMSQSGADYWIHRLLPVLRVALD